LDSAEEHLMGYINGIWSPCQFVMGSVWLWGAVYEYEKGWRAEWAQVGVLYPQGSPNAQRMVIQVAQDKGFELDFSLAKDGDSPKE
jgi:hypothetical protein